MGAEESIYFEPSPLGEKELGHFEPLLLQFIVHFSSLMEFYQEKEPITFER